MCFLGGKKPSFSKSDSTRSFDTGNNFSDDDDDDENSVHNAINFVQQNIHHIQTSEQIRRETKQNQLLGLFAQRKAEQVCFCVYICLCLCVYVL